MKEFSLWITPQGEAQKRLEAVVENLSSKFVGPRFEPHMTLLGPISQNQELVVEKAQLLAKKLKPFELEVGEVDFSSTYFQCIFVRIRSSAPLLEARIAAQEAYNISSFFMPHISLYYGNISPQERENIAKSITLPRLSFMVDKIIVTPATLDPSTWEHLAEIKLEA